MGALARAPTRGMPPASPLFVLDEAPDALVGRLASCRPDGTAGGRLRVLVAEEDAITVRVLRHRLERDGLAVDAVADGLDALDRLTTAPPDVALLDVALVGLDGFELVRRIRAGEAGPRGLPVALLCGAGHDAQIVRGFALDADDVIVRPFSLAEVSARLRRLARRHRPDLA